MVAVKMVAVKMVAVKMVAVTKATATKAVDRKSVGDDAPAAATAGTRVTQAEDVVVAPRVKAAGAVRAAISADEVGMRIAIGIAAHLAGAARSSPPVKSSKAPSKVSWNCIPEVTDSSVNQRRTTSRRIRIPSSQVHWSRSTSCGKAS